ncbi:serine carboxypeptidase S28-domain-containing protein [Lasiosphaeria miniovina]|uniref:Serine carboxypeptidase S28-domain-containing protein n=1 Tax=Lasiosphaeria miniovina TaxID=1954250 RepID=A0AA40BFB2_9PEZI|nr:serine carboxypeptidase S28-domain-containing protein [Lasiosphaeria miniovina]KAK0733165.1 serine carboxypeptidase S28-domain-containing protein [Lasiosphaeria miniovina]
MKSFVSAALAAAQLLLAGPVSAGALNRGHGMMEIGPIDTVVETHSKRAEQAGLNGWGTFDQLIDHANPKLGTFKQRYWYGAQYWKGPGSPIILVNPGEQAADGFNRTYTTAARLPGLFAQETGGAVVVMEHRYWGESSPYPELTIQNLKYLTLWNSLKDISYFANNFVPPFDPSGGSSPKNAPWVFSGGSYSGALAGWSAALDPGTIWAYHGTSGVVEAIGDFWQYFVPVQEATPQNCSRDLSATIDSIDLVLKLGTPKQKHDLKQKFLLTDLTDADFASALEYGPWSWQSSQFYSTTTQGFNPYYQFCDYIENVWPNSTNPVPGAKGVGVAKALEGYAKWFKEVELPGSRSSLRRALSELRNADATVFALYSLRGWRVCRVAGHLQHGLLSEPERVQPRLPRLDCRQLFQPPVELAALQRAVRASQIRPLDSEANHSLRSFEYWQDGAPVGRPTIVSRLVTADYWRQQCNLWFPRSQGGGGVGIAQGKRANDVNRWTGGWSATKTKRLMYANGGLDPWRDSTVSSIFRPGGPLKSTEQLPVRVIAGGMHCSDLYGPNWGVNPGVQQIVNDEVANIKTWIAEFYELNNKSERSEPRPRL